MNELIIIDHRYLKVSRNFEEFTNRLEEGLGIMAPEKIRHLGADPASMETYLSETSTNESLVLYNIFDQSITLDQFQKKKIKAKQYHIGNPKMISKMTGINSSTGLYLPIRLLVYENPRQQVIVEYDLPFSLLERLNNMEIDRESIILDKRLQMLIDQADRKNL
ncbi:DUF302 domain-containing protein [Mucilaginibacter sp.]|uniref:DUF302 domain-containing protein n=1 Tax=Mucilaginibacter sp. TaxID=1882438 RepID=UPI002625F1DB|nr:DUF302 domain-containing protein [Mucilaginibacter sp.]MDB4926750.1 hypothetical protein [Mucilaginibacter sp.]